MRRTFYFLPAFSIAIIIFILSTADGRDLPEVDLVNADKLAHLLCYLVFTACLVWGFSKSIAENKRWLSAGIAFTYGAMMEMIQDIFILSRHFDFYDLWANGLGCILCVLLIPFIIKN